MSDDYNIVVLISGQGSLLPGLIEQAQHYDIQAIISNNPNAPGLTIAEEQQIPSMVCDHQQFSTRHHFDADLQHIIDRLNPDLIVLAGFMRRLGPAFCRHFAGRIINIHPSLLPKYPGLHTFQRALDAHDAQHGSSIHLVDDSLDAGPMVAQIAFDIDPEDDASTLKQKTQAIEKDFYPQVINAFATQHLCWRAPHLYYHDKIVDKSGLLIKSSNFFARQ